MATAAETSSVEIRVMEETDWGVIPGNPFNILRFTSESFKTAKETAVSDEIISSRMVKDVVPVGFGMAGDIAGRLSYGTYDNFGIEGAATAAFAAEDNVSGTTIGATASGFSDSGNGLDVFEVGQFVKVTGFADPTIDGYYRLTTVSAGSVDTFPTPPATETAGASVTIKSSLLKAATSPKSFVLEREWTNLDSATMEYWSGVRIDSFELSFDLGEMISVAMSVIGKKGQTAASTQGTGGPNAATTTSVMTANQDLLRIGEGGALVDEALSLSMAIGNNLRRQDRLGSTDPRGIGHGTRDVTGRMALYFTDDSKKTLFLNDTETSIEFVVTDLAGNAYGFFMPRVKFTDEETPTPGQNQDVEQALPYRALEDATLGTDLLVSRMAA